MVPKKILPPHLSAPVLSAAESQQLGMFLKTYPFTLTEIIKDILLYNLLPGGVFLIASLPQDSSSPVGSLISLLCALCFFWLALSKIFLIIQRTTRRLHLFQGGLVIEKRHQVQVCPWHQVTEIWQNLTNWRGKVGPRRYSYLYTLRLVDGSQIKLNDLTEGIAGLGRTVSQNITQELLPQALNALQCGESLSFGPTCEASGRDAAGCPGHTCMQ